MTTIAFVAHWDWVLYNFRLPLARRLRALGADVTFVSPPGQYVGRLREAGFRHVPWTVVRRSVNPLRELRAVLALLAVYRRERFDAVHHFTIKPVLYGSMSARWTGVPRTINSFTGLGYLFSDVGSARRVRRLVLPFLRVVLNGRGMHTVFQNDEDRAVFVRRKLVPARRTSVIVSSGVDTECFKPAPDALEGEPVVLMAARLLWDKGVGEFVEAARRLRASGARATFSLAGDRDPGNPRSVGPEIIDRWCREGDVGLLGHRDDMPALLQRAAIAVLPSYHEGVPRFLLEAAASGLPLVASNLEACRLVVRPGVNGVLVPPRDVDALTAAISSLLADVDTRAKMGRESRAIALAEFEESKILDHYVNAYRALGILP